MSDASRQIPLSVPVIGDMEQHYVSEALSTGWVSSSGTFIPRFEDAVASLTGSPQAVACQSGTAALHVALRVAGVQPGDEVLVPTLTFIATVNPVAYLGAKPVFIGCDEYMNIDPDAVASFLEEECVSSGEGVIDRATGRRVAAIVPVHVFGNPCQMEPLLAIASKWELPVVEDAAESLGSKWTEGVLAGRHAGTVGRIGCLSFNGNKIITTGGGGMILTGDSQIADEARHLTTQAKADPVRFIHDEIGYNYRMTNLAAAVGVAQLETLEARIEAKRRNRELYAELLSDVNGIRILDTPPGTNANNWFYSAIIDAEEFGRTRDQVMDALAAVGVQTRPVWQLGHRQRPYADERTYRVEKAEWFADRVLNLPCTHTLSREDVEYVCDAIRHLGD
jgi:perosamine synthetase